MTDSRRTTRLAKWQPRFTFWSLILTASLTSCSSGWDGSTLEGKAAILDAANMALSHGDCDAAITLVEGLYNSTNTDNEVRQVRASAHACKAGLDSLFGFTATLATSAIGPVAGTGLGLWRKTAELFYKSSSTVLDTRISAALSASDACLSQITPGFYVLTQNAFNTDTFNTASTLPSDRTVDGNFYAMMVSLAGVGALQDRYSAPNTSTWVKGHVVGYTSANNTGWAVATADLGDGCAFASSILNFTDSATQILPNLKGTLKTALSSVSGLAALLDQACEDGCNGTYATTGCALAAGTCFPCPKTLRNYNSCTGKVTDKNSCAAAGIANFMNTNTSYGWFP